jgi:hypothetical protein
MAKRTRRERRLEVDKQKPVTPKTVPPEESTADLSAPLITEASTPALSKSAQATPLNNRKMAAEINFAQEYHYVYSELTIILIITAILFAVMIGLSFVI